MFQGWTEITCWHIVLLNIDHQLIMQRYCHNHTFKYVAARLFWSIAGQNTNNKIMTDCVAGYCLLKHFGSARFCYKNPHRLYSILSSNNTCNGWISLSDRWRTQIVKYWGFFQALMELLGTYFVINLLADAFSI